MELTYRNEGDYLIPNIKANEEPEESLTKYGMLRETFLKEHHEGIYTGKLLSGTLTEHCLMIQKQAEERFERLKNQMMENEEVTEELKSRDQMEWVRLMNSITNRADEIVLSEIVYSL
ncbi:TnpV protein [Coprococcus eutactus]|uniref:TnpV protein n=1 Tax=Coprococcus eutactus TaxID=33043 RepID=UPI0020799FC0|nr:TnpV protein [Coprococcus eutactus]